MTPERMVVNSSLFGLPDTLSIRVRRVLFPVSRLVGQWGSSSALTVGVAWGDGLDCVADGGEAGWKPAVPVAKPVGTIVEFVGIVAEPVGMDDESTWAELTSSG